MATGDQQQSDYPGARATAFELLALAGEYKRAAELLRLSGRPKIPVSRAPYRLVSMQAIELYLNALLLAKGHPPDAIRGHMHDLRGRSRLAQEHGLKLRHGTAAHLERMTDCREYLVARYDPGMAGVSQLNRLEATLNEVAGKVVKIVAQAGVDASSSTRLIEASKV